MAGIGEFTGNAVMLLEMLLGKIHRAAVTACHLEYHGSLTVDLDLIEKSGLRVHQKIQLLNISNGQRIETYLIPGKRGGREFIVNGAAARLFYPGDRIIVAGYAHMTPEEADSHHPAVVVLDEHNQIVEQI